MAPQNRKRPRDDDGQENVLSDEAEAAFRTVREIFPSKSWRFLRDKVVNWPGGRVEELVDQLLVSETYHGENNESLITLDDIVDDDVIAGDSKEEKETADNSIVFADYVPDSAAGQASSSSPAAGGYIEKNYAMLCSVFPDVSPVFLQEQAWNIGNDAEKMEAFISNSLESKSSLPSRKEYEKTNAKQVEERNIRDMKVTDFLSQYTDPHQHFMDTTTTVNDIYKGHALFYITKHFPRICVSEVKKVLEQHNGHFLPTIKQVEKMLPSKKGKKVVKTIPIKPKEMDLQFLKEYIYFKLEPKIRKYQAKQEKKRVKAVEEARKVGGLFECQICLDSECLVAEVAMCEAGCMFCRDCVRRGAEVQIGDSKSIISCLITCGEDIPLAVLQLVLPAAMFSKLVQRRQLEEVQAAGLEDLVQCPACSFATIMPDPEDKVIICGNQECGKHTCRICGEESHVPLSCDEVEKDGEVVARTNLEDAMTKAMVRECVKCKKRYFKDEGCNKMQCECGQSMCYLCRKPVANDYTHFYAQGASPAKGKCPLWSDNTNLHKAEVMKAAEEAKKKVESGKLKYDPTKNMEKPPVGFDPKALHNNFGGYGEYIQGDDDSDEDDDNDEDEDEEDEDEEDDDEEDEDEEDEEDENDYRPFDWM
eukprot:GFUD01052404.1.p1 GENE.GFUD01052404.1~~GFUD01052404.1.p1  ORF type:complete len:647 (-),score=285.05 GFUD01052404.1:100-2040(-)